MKIRSAQSPGMARSVMALPPCGCAGHEALITVSEISTISTTAKAEASGQSRLDSIWRWIS